MLMSLNRYVRPASNGMVEFSVKPGRYCPFCAIWMMAVSVSSIENQLVSTSADLMRLQIPGTGSAPAVKTHGGQPNDIGQSDSRSRLTRIPLPKEPLQELAVRLVVPVELRRPSVCEDPRAHRVYAALTSHRARRCTRHRRHRSRARCE